MTTQSRADKQAGLDPESIDANGVVYMPGQVLRGKPPEREVLLATEFVAKMHRIKTCKWGSYGLKHYVEKCVSSYISNGAVIVAALKLGIPVKPIPGSPNCLIGLSKAKERARRTREQS
jgi:hypothetical protein